MHHLRLASSSLSLSISLRLTKFLPLRTLWMLLEPLPSSSPLISSSNLPESSRDYRFSLRRLYAAPLFGPRPFCSSSPNSNALDESQAPAAVDYRSVLQEAEFHRLADSTIHHLLEKLEEYGDAVDLDGFDIDYGNEVLTLKLGSLGTYVVNKQTPNRQIWLSSPVSGPSRYDWDPSSEAWVYRRNKANLLRVLESELAKLCGQPVNFS